MLSPALVALGALLGAAGAQNGGGPPRFICTALPPGGDVGCGASHGALHEDGHGGGSHHGGGGGHGEWYGAGLGGPHGGGGVQGDLHEDLHAAVLRLREALVQQREAALELAAKLGQCEARGGGGGHPKEGGGSHEAEEGGGGHEEPAGAARGHAAGDAAAGTANQQRALQGLRQRLQQLQHSRNVSGLREALQKKIGLLELQLHHHGNGSRSHGNPQPHGNQLGDHQQHLHGNHHGGHHGDHGNQQHHLHGSHHSDLHGNHHSDLHGNHHSDLHGNHHHGDHGKSGDHGNQQHHLHGNHHGGHHGDHHSKLSSILHEHLHGNHPDLHGNHHGGHHGDHHHGFHGNHHGHHGDHNDKHGDHSHLHGHHGDHHKAIGHHGSLHGNHHGHHGDHDEKHGDHSNHHGHHGDHKAGIHHHEGLHGNHHGHHGNHSKAEHGDAHHLHGNQQHRLHGDHQEKHGHLHGNHRQQQQHHDGFHGNQHSKHSHLHGDGLWDRSGRHGDGEEEEEGSEEEEEEEAAPPGPFLVAFPRRTNYIHARLLGTLRRGLRALSVCLWLRAGGGPPLGTPFSYAAPGQPNELVLLAWGGRPLELLVDDQAVPLALSPSPGRWHHLCVTWAAAGGSWRSFQDGVPRGAGGGLAAGHPLRPRGVLVLGQEQDSLGGRFEAAQAFVGDIAGFALWGRVLGAPEVAALAACGSAPPGGALLGWDRAGLELHGGAAAAPFQRCS